MKTEREGEEKNQMRSWRAFFIVNVYNNMTFSRSLVSVIFVLITRLREGASVDEGGLAAALVVAISSWMQTPR